MLRKRKQQKFMAGGTLEDEGQDDRLVSDYLIRELVDGAAVH